MLRFGPDIELDRMAFGAEIVRLEALVADLWHVSIHNFPAAGATRDTPILENWRLAFRPSLCLVGFATGHPKVSGSPAADRDLRPLDAFGPARIGQDRIPLVPARKASQHRFKGFVTDSFAGWPNPSTSIQVSFRTARLFGHHRTDAGRIADND